MNTHSREKQLQGLIQSSDDELKSLKQKFRELTVNTQSSTTIIDAMKKQKEKLLKQMESKDKELSEFSLKQRQLTTIINSKEHLL